MQIGARVGWARMTQVNKVVVRVPASTANLGPGFDTLGMALNLYHWIQMEVSEIPQIECYGDHLDGIPTDRSNLVYQIAEKVFEEAGHRPKPLSISMYSQIPLTRGLGSSASAIVGGLVAANALLNNPLSRDRLFQIASSLEEHPDNVGASLFGGIVVAYWDGHHAEHIRIDAHPHMECLVVIPEFQLLTSEARHMLPEQISLKDAVFNIGHSSLLVAALSTGRLDMISHAMKDVLHQPYRCARIPGMASILEHGVDNGALGIALSGAGPTMIAFVDRSSKQKKRLQNYMTGVFLDHGIASQSMWLTPEPVGAEVLTHFDESRTFIENVEGEKALWRR